MSTDIPSEKPKAEIARCILSINELKRRLKSGSFSGEVTRQRALVTIDNLVEKIKTFSQQNKSTAA